MKLRYIVDIDIDESNTELAYELTNDIKDFVKDHEYGYMANSVDVKLQDEYCMKEERRIFKAGNKIVNKKKPVIKYGELHKTHNLGRLMSFHCPNCGKFLGALYETDVLKGCGFGKDYNGCINCLQAIDFTGYYADGYVPEMTWKD